MPVISVPQEFNEEDLYVDLRSIFGRSLYLKCEGFNFAGSIKLKAAMGMVEAAERDGRLRPDSVLVESSSGNLGVALSMIAASKGYQFLCVTDSRCNLATRRLMEALGSQVHIISEPDPRTGFLGARIDYVESLCLSDDRYVWLNQYANPENWKAHYRTTAPAIASGVPGPGCAVRRRRNDRDPDGLRALLPRVAPAGVGRRHRRRRLAGLRWSAGSPDDPRPRHQCPSGSARRVLRGRGDNASRRPTPSAPATDWPEAGSCSAAPPAPWSAGRWTGWLITTRRISRRWPSPQTSASAISTPCTSRTGCRPCTETTYSIPQVTAPAPSA